MDLERPIDKIIRHYRINLVLPYITPNIHLCDIGCGMNPYLLKSLAQTNTDKLVGLDNLVANKLIDNIELRTANLDHTPLPIDNKEFDIITMLAVLEHLNNYSEVISECCRGLKNGGKLIMTTPSPLSKPILEFLANLRIISYESIRDHKKYFNKNEISELLQQHGFTDIRVWTVACGLNTVALATKK